MVRGVVADTPAAPKLDRVVIFECRMDAEHYAGLLRGQGIAQVSVEAVKPRHVLIFSAQSGCRSSFSPAGTYPKPPDMRAEERAKFMYYGGGATASERHWIPPAAGYLSDFLGHGAPDRCINARGLSGGVEYLDADLQKHVAVRVMHQLDADD